MDEKVINVEELEKKVKRYQAKDFKKWREAVEKLAKIDPQNPLCKVGFYGKPYFVWKGD
jgi:hypothetical protein